MTFVEAGTTLPQGSVMATIGMFDGVHLGHITLIDALIAEARRRGLQSAVVTFDMHPRHVLHSVGAPAMIQSLRQRMDVLQSLEIDYLVVLHFDRDLAAHDSGEFMRMLRDTYGVSALMMGYNHRFGHNASRVFSQYVDLGRQLGIDVVKAPEYLGEYAPVSSTIIRGLIQAGRVVDAMHCLGRPYRLEGRVVHGFRNGRAIGFPTANVGECDTTQVLPHSGAYAVMVDVADQRLQGMVNVGYRPTISDSHQLSVEVNIFDFDGDIYGRPIALDFIGFLRLEFKMVSIAELSEQLARDREKARAILDRYASIPDQALTAKLNT